MFKITGKHGSGVLSLRQACIVRKLAIHNLHLHVVFLLQSHNKERKVNCPKWEKGGTTTVQQSRTRFESVVHRAKRGSVNWSKPQKASKTTNKWVWHLLHFLIFKSVSVLLTCCQIRTVAIVIVLFWQKSLTTTSTLLQGFVVLNKSSKNLPL